VGCKTPAPLAMLLEPPLIDEASKPSTSRPIILFIIPPLIEPARASAVFSIPPLIEAKSPLAVFVCPPLTEAKWPLISLPAPTTNPPKLEKLFPSPNTTLCEPVRVFLPPERNSL
jgi:hypothetical protein